MPIWWVSVAICLWWVGVATRLTAHSMYIALITISAMQRGANVQRAQLCYARMKLIMSSVPGLLGTRLLMLCLLPCEGQVFLADLRRGPAVAAGPLQQGFHQDSLSVRAVPISHHCLLWAERLDHQKSRGLCHFLFQLSALVGGRCIKHGMLHIAYGIW